MVEQNEKEAGNAKVYLTGTKIANLNEQQQIFMM